MDKWKLEAIDLHETGEYSWREIAKRLGMSKSTVSDYLRKYIRQQDVYKKPEKKKGPRILIYDIETAPMLSYCFGLFNQNIGLNQIHKDWHLLSWAAKWLGEDTIYYEDQRNAENLEDDSQILKGIWKLLDEADIVITQNGVKFDNKKLASRFVMNGMPPPSPYRNIDTLQIAKKCFGFTSNKLAYMTERLCKKYKKIDHGEMPGFELWKQCMAKNPRAFELMESYNIYDILSLEELYHIIAPYSTNLPIFEVYEDEVVERGDWVQEGYVYTNLAKYERFRNTETGQYRRGHVNLLAKEKRDSLLRNI